MNKHPKRRKDKDNPYTINKNDNSTYTITFQDSIGNLQTIEVSKEIYDAFDRFELDDLSEMNEFDNHIEHSEILENKLNARAMDKPISLEDEIIKESTFDKLKKAIGMLPEVQKRRIKKYYFEDMTFQQIAESEGCSKVAIKLSIVCALQNLKKFLKK